MIAESRLERECAVDVQESAFGHGKEEPGFEIAGAGIASKTGEIGQGAVRGLQAASDGVGPFGTAGELSLGESGVGSELDEGEGKFGFSDASEGLGRDGRLAWVASSHEDFYAVRVAWRVSVTAAAVAAERVQPRWPWPVL
jgi:hypothetical protein